MPLSSLAIIFGYIFVVFRPNTSVGLGYAPNHYDFYYTYFGLILIAAGFISILLYSRQVSFNGESSTPKIKWKQKKTVLIFSLILIISILIGGYHLKIQRENDSLQQNYQFVRQGFPRLVNDEWTNNEGVDSNFVNYKGALFNSGLDKIYNATLLVRVKGPDGTTLERVEFFIGEIKGWN